MHRLHTSSRKVCAGQQCLQMLPQAPNRLFLLEVSDHAMPVKVDDLQGRALPERLSHLSGALMKCLRQHQLILPLHDTHALMTDMHAA